MDPAPMGPIGCSEQPGWIQEDVGCVFPGLDKEQLRQAQWRDPDVAVVEAALQEEKIPFLMMFGHESRLLADLLFGIPPPQPEEESQPVEHLMGTLQVTCDRAYQQGEAAGRPF
ncbi:unnamed protein product [Lampetra fluviatilis]